MKQTDAVIEALLTEKAPGTQEAYQSDWRLFAEYCVANKRAALPAAADTVMQFLTNGSERTLIQRCAAIKWAHERCGWPSPITSEVKDLIRGLTKPKRGRRSSVASKAGSSACSLRGRASPVPPLRGAFDPPAGVCRVVLHGRALIPVRLFLI